MKTTIKNNLFILKLLWKTNKLAFVIQFFYSVLIALLSPLTILINKYLVDELTAANHWQRLIAIIILMLVVNIAFGIINSLMSYRIRPIIMWKFNLRLNTDFMKKSLLLDLACFDDPDFYDQYTRALSAADSQANHVFNQFFSLLKAVVQFCGIISILILLDPIIILFAVGSVLIGFIFDIFINQVSEKEKMHATLPLRWQNYIKNRVMYQPQYAKDLRLNLGLYSLLSHKYEAAVNQVFVNIKKYGKKYLAIVIPKVILGESMSFGQLVYMSLGVFNGTITIGTFVSLLNSSQSFAGALSGLTSSLSAFFQSSLEIGHLLDILKKEPAIEAAQGKDLDRDQIEIDVRDVSFRYPNSNTQVLNHINFSISKGEHVAVVGLNGAGKSTLIKLLCRLYDPDLGEILYNNIDLRDYSIKSIRSSIATVFQDFNIYALSIAENIAKEENINDRFLNQSIERSGLKAKLEKLDLGMHTILSNEFPGGTNLSGGEGQKIAIASAIYKDAKILIFDEPTSALDPLAEHEIFESINSIFFNRTTIMVSHRLANVVHCGKIIYLENGRIAECGTHRELMTLNGKYANLFHMQSKEYIAAGREHHK